MLETIELEKSDGVAVVRLARPPVNAVNQAMMGELRVCFEDLSQDRKVATIILGGASKALRLLGPSKALRMLFLGELLPARELYRLGGIEEVVPAGEAEARAIEIAAQLAKKSPIALRLAKQSVLRIEADQVMQQYRTENDYTDRLRTFDDSREAAAAFIEKRPPKWTWS